ncbi:MAG: dockerin type I repeat-containing protein [bacterium]
MTERGAFICRASLSLILICAWFALPPAARAQPTDQPSVVFEIVESDIGQQVDVGINWFNIDPGFEIGGFDLLFSFDTLALTLLSADPGQMLVDCKWEYFEWRQGAGTDCGDSVCPSGIARVVAVADLNNGTPHPSCYGDTSGELVNLSFQVADEEILDCQYLPVRCIWFDCGDNSFSNLTGETLYVSRDVYDWEGYYVQIDQNATFPTYFGASDTCIDSPGGITPPVRMIDIYNGGVNISCSEPPSVVFEIAESDIDQQVDVGINWFSVDPGFEIGGFDLLFSFDTLALTLLSADPGQMLVDCQWEYFEYRQGTGADCGGTACPSGIARVVAVADLNNGTPHPSCYGDTLGELVSLSFLVANDSALDCLLLPIRPIWFDCGDNSFSNLTGETLYVSREVYDYQGGYVRIDQDAPFPTFYGAPDTCLDSTGGKTPPVRMIDYYNGGIEVLCHDSIDDRGDINLNGIAYEIADWVVFVNYLMYGLDAFLIDPEVQAQNTDVNADAVLLTLDDLVYLWRNIVGDAMPFPRAPFDTAVFTQDATNRIVEVAYPDSLSAVYLVFRGEIEPTNLVNGLQMANAYDSTFTRVLLTPDFSVMHAPVFEPGFLITYTGDGLLEEAHASYDGLLGIEESIVLMGFTGSQAVIVPDTFSSYWAFLPDILIGTVYIGDFSGYDVSDIDTSTLLINGTITPLTVQIIPAWSGFIGDILEITFSAGEFTEGYIPQYDTSLHNYLVSGGFNDLSPFAVIGDVTVAGLLRGDVDFSGDINVGDITYLVAYMFQDGDPPPVMETADVDGSGEINVGDITALVTYLFGP